MSPTSSSASSTPILSTATARPSASSTWCSASASNLSRNAFMATLIKGRRIATESAPSPEQGEVLRLEPTDDPASVADRLDRVYYLESCGFDAFLLRDGEDPEEALAAFNDFSESYQASVARPLPLFRRRFD